MTLLWNAESLWEELEPLLPGLSIEVVPQTASTNTTLLERARALGEDDTTLAQVRRSRESAAFGRRAADVLPCLLVAEHQTGGRGRMGRTWSSSRGASLTFSLSLPMGNVDWSGLSLAVGVALADAIEPRPAAAGPRVGLKWPNDLWLLDRQTPEALSGRKLGGILIESTTVGRNRLAVIGVGLNVLPLPAGTPAELTTGYACLDELDPGISAPAALGRIARPLVDALVAFQRDGFPAFMERFAARDLLRGRAVTTTLADLPEGVAQGIAPSGALLVLTPQGAVRDVASGEVSVRLQGAAEDAPC
jgi:BirA family biotin operon repressor/biotin-[acetyl-CoA-carboxylase] ligase